MNLKEQFLMEFNENKWNSVEVNIKMKDYPTYEKIINPKENFKFKKEYYKNAYDDNLRLKSCNDIMISSYLFKNDKISMLYTIADNQIVEKLCDYMCCVGEIDFDNIHAQAIEELGKFKYNLYK